MIGAVLALGFLLLLVVVQAPLIAALAGFALRALAIARGWSLPAYEE